MRTHTDMTKNLRLDIQAYRAVAVLLVVLYHANLVGISGGYIGVDVFFVISGFLITGQLIRTAKRDGNISLRKFYAARFKRLAAPAAIVGLTTLALAWAFGPILMLKEYTTHAAAAALFGVNYLFAFRGLDYQRAEELPSPFLHYWSLSVEEQFYILWPILILACFALFRKNPIKAATITIAALCITSLGLSTWLTLNDTPMGYFSLQSRAWELGAGALLALHGKPFKGTKLSQQLIVGAALAAIIACAYLYTSSTPFPGLPALIPVLATVALLHVGTGTTPLPGMSSPAIQHIGATSYSFYLWHWPFLALAPVMFTGNVPLWARLACVAIAYAAATATYRWVEQPIRKTKLAPTRWIAFGLATAMAVTAAAATVRIIHTIPTPSAPVAERPAPVVEPTAVLRGLAEGPAPKNLTPNLKAAKWDLPTVSKDGCHLNYEATALKDCVYGDRAGVKKMMLLGDSHAAHWMPGLDEAARTHGYVLQSLSKAACPVGQLSVYSARIRRDYVECGLWREAVLERVKAEKPDVVVLAQSDKMGFDQGVTSQQWADALGTTIAELQPHVGKVVVMLDNPYGDVSVPQCLANNLDNPSRCEIRADGKPELVAFREAIRAEADLQGAASIDSYSYLCGEGGVCPMVVADMMVYRDSHHITPVYSTWLAPALAHDLGLS